MSWSALQCGLHELVGALEIVQDDGLAEGRVEAQQGAVGAVGVEGGEGELVVDVILGQEPRQDGLADPALLAADEVDLAHTAACLGGWNHGEPGLAGAAW